MNWESVAEFLVMGGYAAYVWGSFGAVLAGLALESLLLARRRACALRCLRQQAVADRLDRQTA